MEQADIALCSDCFHNARFVTGHSSLDFQIVDGMKDRSDTDGDRWTDQETLLLLEGIEKFNDNWNHIAGHVRTKSKAQCIQHFIRLPVEDGLLENIEVPEASLPSRMQSNGFLHSDSNGSTSGVFFYLLNHLSHFYYTLVYMIAKFIRLLYFWLMICSLGCSRQSSQSGNQIPFINSANPVMSLVSYKLMHFYIQICILKCLNAFTLVFTGLLYGPVMCIHLYYKF